MLPNNTIMDENKAWQWHGIMSGHGATAVPFPQIQAPLTDDLYDGNGDTNYLHTPSSPKPDMYDGDGNLNYLFTEGC